MRELTVCNGFAVTDERMFVLKNLFALQSEFNSVEIMNDMKG